MNVMRVFTVSMVLALVSAAPSAEDSAERAGQLYAEGQALLAKADFEGALRCYQAAAKMDPEELNHDIRAAILRRVIAMRARLGELEGGAKWLPTARALHTYYVDNRVYSEAIALARAMHAKDASADSALCLARTHLALDENAEAEAVLRAASPGERSPQVHALLGIAIARQDRPADARAVWSDLKAPDQPDPQLSFDMARLCALLGDTDGAAGALAACFENTPPSRLAAAKSAAREHIDLAALRAHPQFAAALDTESKVTESKCSSGTSCDKCPSRAACGSDTKESKPEEK